MHRTVFAATVFAIGLSVPAQAEVAEVSKTIDGFIRPAYRELAQDTVSLAGAMGGLCAAPGDAAAARQAFAETVRAWSTVETIRIGPITEENRLERFLFWPDRKGIGLKQVQAAIANEDATALDAGSLAAKSVAMQGLGALEFVLYGTGSEALTSPEGNYRCRYGLAIAKNLAAIADETAKAWDATDGFAKAWTNPGPDNALYRTDDEALTDLLEIPVHGLEQVRDTRLNAFLGANADQDKPKLAPFWRSQLTAVSLKANMDGLAHLFAQSGLGDLATGEAAYLKNSIGFEFGNADKALQGLPDDAMADLLKDKDARAKLDYFRVVTSSLTGLFGTQLSGALGLSAGFSSLDGD